VTHLGSCYSDGQSFKTCSFHPEVAAGKLFDQDDKVVKSTALSSPRTAVRCSTTLSSRANDLPDGKLSVKGTAVKTLTQPQLWVPHISLVFGEMWEMNLLSRVDPPGFVH
jgi:hypothetical protein